MKIINALPFFLIIGMTFSCSNNTNLFKDGLELKEVNDKVAKENKCKLTFYYSKQDPDQLILTISNAYNDDYLPGKIVDEYYTETSKTKVKVNKYQLRNSDQDTLIDLTTKELNSFQKKKKSVQLVINSIIDGNFEEIYDQMDTSITNKMSVDDLKAQFTTIKLENSKFTGFQLFSDYVGIRFSNNYNNIFIVYPATGDDNRIFGITVN